MSIRAAMPALPGRGGGLPMAGLVWDLAIMVLVVINLALIVFDSLFAADVFAALVHAISPLFHDWYAGTIHANFATIDLYFVAVYVLDVLGGWAIAVWRQRYHRWFFYPFVHWYDVLGCIPVAGFRWLRALRVIALGVRLQRLGLIDVRNWYAFEVAKKYYDIFVEEVSDRVVVNVLSGVQEEVNSGASELSSRVVREVIQPRKQQLVKSVSQRVEQAVSRAYGANQNEIQGYVANLVDRAVAGNTAMAGLAAVPMLGRAVTASIGWAIRDAVNNVLDEAVAGLDSPQFDELVQHIADSVFDIFADDAVATDPELREALVEILELVKAQVRVQRWKQTYA